MSLDYPADCKTDLQRMEWLYCAAEKLRQEHNAAKDAAGRTACLDKQKIVLCMAARYRDRLGLSRDDALSAETVAAVKLSAQKTPAYTVDTRAIDAAKDTGQLFA